MCQVGLPSLPLPSDRSGQQLTPISDPYFSRQQTLLDRNGNKGGCPSEPLRLSLRVTPFGAGLLLLCPLPTKLLSSLSTFYYPLQLSRHSDFPQLLLLVFTSLYTVFFQDNLYNRLSGPTPQPQRSHSQRVCFPFHHAHSTVGMFPLSPFSHLFLSSLLSVCSESVLHRTGPLLCLFLLTFSLAKDGKFQRPELVMAGCLFWKSNGLDAKGMSWSYTSGKVVP